MNSSNQKIGIVRQFVFAFGVLGLALVLLLASIRDDRSSGFGNGTFVAMFGSPFVLALFSLALGRLERQRWIWLLCALLAAIAAFPLIFNGVGFFVLAIAIGFAWAFVTTGRGVTWQRRPR